MSRRKKLSWAVAAILVLAACGREGDLPGPPKSPPRPMTYGGGHAFTAQLDLPARPKQSSPGEM